MDTMISTRPAQPEELAWINARYSEVRFVPSTPSDTLVIAEVDGIRAGVGRISALDEHNAELGGILVFEQFRGRGVAAEIVRDLLDRGSRSESNFCLPFTHLSAFYKSFDFREPNTCGVNVSEHISSKLAWCLKEYETTTTLLVRNAKVD
jgi:GNAT superfamily N-acetyltransferase